MRRDVCGNDANGTRAIATSARARRDRDENRRDDSNPRSRGVRGDARVAADAARSGVRVVATVLVAIASRARARRDRARPIRVVSAHVASHLFFSEKADARGRGSLRGRVRDARSARARDRPRVLRRFFPRRGADAIARDALSRVRARERARVVAAARFPAASPRGFSASCKPNGCLKSLETRLARFSKRN